MKLKTLTLAMLNVLAASSLFTAQNANADINAESTTPLSTSTASTTNLGSVTVSASPINDHERLDVPSQIDSLSGADKAQNESGSLGKMLEGIPGVNNMATGTQAGDRKSVV